MSLRYQERPDTTGHNAERGHGLLDEQGKDNRVTREQLRRTRISNACSLCGGWERLGKACSCATCNMCRTQRTHAIRKESEHPACLEAGRASRPRHVPPRVAVNRAPIVESSPSVRNAALVLRSNVRRAHHGSCISRAKAG